MICAHQVDCCLSTNDAAVRACKRQGKCRIFNDTKRKNIRRLIPGTMTPSIVPGSNLDTFTTKIQPRGVSPSLHPPKRPNKRTTRTSAYSWTAAIGANLNVFTATSVLTPTGLDTPKSRDVSFAASPSSARGQMFLGTDRRYKLR